MLSITKQKYRGFTLIELMLVIVVVAVISLYAINLRRVRRDNAMAQQAATQMQMIDEAVYAYYLANGEFPSHPDALSKLISAGYLPETAACSPFIIAQNSGAPCYYHSVYDFSPAGSSGHYWSTLRVAGLPSKDIAERLVKNLPYATAQPDGGGTTTYHVWAYTSVPGASSNLTAFITDAGITAKDQPINLPPYCPTGYTAHVFIIPQNVTTFDASELGMTDTSNHWAMYMGVGGVTGGWETSVVNANGVLGFYPEEGWQSEPPWSPNGTTGDDTDKMYYVYFMAMCIPYDKWFPEFAYTPQDAQCSQTWSDFNFVNKKWNKVPGPYNCTCTADSTVSNNAHRCTIS